MANEQALAAQPAPGAGGADRATFALQEIIRSTNGGYFSSEMHKECVSIAKAALSARPAESVAQGGVVHVPGVGDFPAAYAAQHMPEDDPPPRSRWVTQTKFYDPSQPPEVCTGNCTEAALASILGIGLDEVDSFYGLRSEHYWEAVENFINSKGYDFKMLPADATPDGLYLADGPSDRGCGHFVVMRDGKMVHDPHPSRAGLKEIERVWTLTPTPTPATGSGGEECEVCRIFGDSSLLRKSTAPVNSIDEEMVARALDTLAPQAVTNRYGYSKGYRVRDVLALDDFEATEVIRAILTAALAAQSAPEVGGDGWAAMTKAAMDLKFRHVDNHQGDIYHALQSLIVKYGKPWDGQLTEATRPAESVARGGEAEWITQLRRELALSKMTHAFTFSRDEVIELMGETALSIVSKTPTPATGSGGELQKCPDCKGSGDYCLGGHSAHPDNWRKCESCKGSGKLEHPAPAGGDAGGG